MCLCLSGSLESPLYNCGFATVCMLLNCTIAAIWELEQLTIVSLGNFSICNCQFCGLCTSKTVHKHVQEWSSSWYETFWIGSFSFCLMKHETCGITLDRSCKPYWLFLRKYWEYRCSPRWHFVLPIVEKLCRVHISNKETWWICCISVIGDWSQRRWNMWFVTYMLLLFSLRCVSELNMWTEQWYPSSVQYLGDTQNCEERIYQWGQSIFSCHSNSTAAEFSSFDLFVCLYYAWCKLPEHACNGFLISIYCLEVLMFL